jgi:hypothetical protein
MSKPDPRCSPGELFRDERNVGDVIRVAVTGENIISALDRAQNAFFFGFPFGAETCLAAGKKGDR